MHPILLMMLGFVPGSIWAAHQGLSPLTVFILSGLAIVPLAGLMGTATENIAEVTGPNIGGLLNATMGNATELIIAIVALQAGLTEVVMASLTGSIIGNLLLVMGLSMLLGGAKNGSQTFSKEQASVNSTTLIISAIALLLPAILTITETGLVAQDVSRFTSIILIGIYALTLIFSAKIAPAEEESHEGREKPNVIAWGLLLLGCTAAVGIESEYLVSSLEVATESLHLSFLFTGVILIPILGNAAEHATAVTMAMKNKMDLSVAVAVGSSQQIALFVAPVCVLAGWYLDVPMSLNFGWLEIVAIGAAVVIINSISSDGESNWFEGALLLSTYTILGGLFFQA